MLSCILQNFPAQIYDIFQFHYEYFGILHKAQAKLGYPLREKQLFSIRINNYHLALLLQGIRLKR